jgi:hypothetical protein
MVAPDNVNIEIPVVLRDLIAENRLHARQPYYEIIEEAILYWLDCGGWMPGHRPFTDIPPPAPRRSDATSPSSAAPAPA